MTKLKIIIPNEKQPRVIKIDYPQYMSIYMQNNRGGIDDEKKEEYIKSFNITEDEFKAIRDAITFGYLRSFIQDKSQNDPTNSEDENIR